MKHKVGILFILLVVLVTPLAGRPYVGVSQGLTSSGFEVGFLSRSFEQNLSLHLPLVRAAFKPMSGSVNLLYRTQRLNPLVIGLGLGGRVAWQDDTGILIGGGFVLSLGWEVLAKGEILFIEAAYLPFKTTIWGPLDPLGHALVTQYLRIGWRHVF